MAEKIGWELFRVEYKAALEQGEDIGTAIADSYDKAVKTAVPGIPYFGGTQKGQGSATVPGIIVKSPLKKLMAGMFEKPITSSTIFSCIRYGIKNILDRSCFK